ncbi:long-chain fatty acid--CoA ligase [Yimella sp. cx-51]|uniref:long-chain-fatty-acid--CoA ligase n=1 Tax=Yimella sp. cx-51 TaxID=2770551 RepID=UPI00165D7678|nr:long-chain fatty acid--CoA ligase [Yimella sp. cx-51]MBC9957932.1 long-chain fatty acid--CoA ligase [Yimella sp. cx-51]MBD2759659.1 long-chain fatty acid--CoA ligase [Yimella sp. cx-573]QTH38066.1 long-chain fatty acid--CoA ligase [Yimella sp. cx-51]
MTNLACNLQKTAAAHPDQTALVLGEHSLTYGQVTDAAGRVATMLQDKGIKPGDRVALSLPNVFDFPVIFFGALQAGAVVIPMNPLFRPREVEYYLSDSGASLMFGMGGDAATGAEAVGVPFIEVPIPAGLSGTLADYEPSTEFVDRDDQDTAVILYTSGTTGRPKGAELTHYSLNMNQEVVARTLMDIKPDDVIMGCLPLFHVFGLTCGLSTAFATGATLALVPRFEPGAVLETLGKAGVTIFQGVPTMYQALLAATADKDVNFPALRVCASGGSAMPVEVMKKFEQKFGCIVLEGYGLSETSPVASFNHPNAERKAGSIGTPLEGVEMRLAQADGSDSPAGEIGEIAIRGHLLMKGYWKRPDATAEAIRDGWFFSGDLARVDDDGYFFIVDRSKDMIIRGGYNVYPREVEEVLYEHPEVAEAAVIGVPHEHYGEEVVAYVVRAPGSQLEQEAVQDFAKERLAAYKYPREVRFIDELPKGATGKILKRELRDVAGA